MIISSFNLTMISFPLSSLAQTQVTTRSLMRRWSKLLMDKGTSRTRRNDSNRTRSFPDLRRNNFAAKASWECTPSQRFQRPSHILMRSQDFADMRERTRCPLSPNVYRQHRRWYRSDNGLISWRRRHLSIPAGSMPVPFHSLRRHRCDMDMVYYQLIVVFY